MAKTPSIVTGIDMGRHALKAVVMQRKAGGRILLSHWGYRAFAEPVSNPEQLAHEVKALLKEMGGDSRTCAVALSSPEAIIRIIEQPETPKQVLREGLRLNGMSLLNQECKDYVLDCDRIESSETAGSAESGGPPRRQYLVGGLPRQQVFQTNEVFRKNGSAIHALQLAPVCLFNAFEYAKPETFNEEAFFLLDIGHSTSTMLIGSRKELVLVRHIDFGGGMLLDNLVALSGEGRDSILLALEQEDELMVENLRMALTLLVREAGSSIGFFEGRREEVISKIWVSGGVTGSATILQVMSEELRMLCQPWSVLERFEIVVPEARRDGFSKNRADFNVACGAAAEVLKG